MGKSNPSKARKGKLGKAQYEQLDLQTPRETGTLDADEFVQEGKRQATPLPTKQLVVLCLMQSCDAIAMFQIFPYVAFLILDFGIVDNMDEVGQYAGYIGSSYALATVFSAYIWGMAADKYGRRPILLSGLVGTIICTICFGLSRSLTWAITSRVLWGLSNGNLGVVKTYIAEITDDSNKAKAFTLLGMSGGIGRIAGRH